MRVSDTELMAFVLGELAARDRDRVAAAVAADETLRRTVAEFRELLGDLRAAAPDPPPVHWGAYRTALRARLLEGRARPGWPGWLRWPVPLALSASLAGVLLVLAVAGSHRPGQRQDLASVDEVTLDQRLEMLRDIQVVERLELLEDLDILQSLSAAPGTREG